MDVTRGESIIILPEQPVATKPLPPRPLPFADKSGSVPVEPPPPMPAAIKAAPSPAAPREQPLPAPAFPDILPAPPNTNLQRSHHEALIVNQDNSADDTLRTLTGEVQQFRRAWRLRYAAIDAEDIHGGSVELTGPGLEQLQDGARIRVSGRLIPAADRPNAARFQVQSVYVMEQ